MCERHGWLAQLTCQQNLGRPNAMYGNGAAWPPQAVEPAESLCKACNVSRYTFEPPSIFCTSCQQRIKRNQVRLLISAFLPDPDNRAFMLTLAWAVVLSCPAPDML